MLSFIAVQPLPLEAPNADFEVKYLRDGEEAHLGALILYSQ